MKIRNMPYLSWAFAGLALLGGTAFGQVRITSVAPAAVQPGVTLIVTGNTFPVGVVSANVTARFAPVTSGAGPVVDVALVSLTTLAGSTMRATIVVPAALTVAAPVPYTVSLSAAVAPAFTTAAAGNITVNPPPSLVSANPASGRQTQTLNVVIGGAFSNFFQGLTSVSFAPGITVNSVTVGGPVSVTANITVTPAAALGAANVRVTTGAEALTLTNGFTVLPAPSLVSAVPNTGIAGQTNLNVALTGSGTTWQTGAGTLAASFGAGITVNSIVPSSDTAATANVSIAANAALGVRTITVTKGAETASLVNGFTVQAAPVLLSVTPNSGRQAQSGIAVTIIGQNTAFTGSSAVSFGAGITVSGVVAVNANTITATLAIAADAAAGTRTVTVDGLQLSNAFTVNPGLAVLTSIVPNTGRQGQAAINVSVTGQFTSFVQGTTQLSLGADTVVTNVTVTGPTALTATVSILPAAVLGVRNVVATTGAQTATLANGFTVTSGTPVLLSVAPNSVAQGQVVNNIGVTGQFTSFVQGTTAVSLGAGVTVSNVTVTSPTTVTVTATAAANAAIGSRDVTATTGAEIVSLLSGFSVSSAPAQVSGTLFSLGGTVPVPNAPVRLYSGNGLTFFASATTNAAGVFTFTGVPVDKFSLYAFDQTPSPTRYAYATGNAVASTTVTQNLTLSGTSQVTVRVFTLLGAPAPNAIVGIAPNGVPVPGDIQNLLRAQQTAGANGQTVFATAFSGNLTADAADSNGQFSSIVYATVAAGAAITIDITLNAPEAASAILSVYNGPGYSDRLPTGQNEGTSAILSLYNGVPYEITLPPGQNEGASAIISLYNGLPYTDRLPTGQNEAVTSTLLAQVTNNGGPIRIRNSVRSATGGRADFSTAEGQDFNRLLAGETVTLESEYPAPFYINGALAGNDASFPNQISFVVPEGPAGLSIRAGSSAETFFPVEAAETVHLAGELLGADGAPMAKAEVWARYAGVRGELFPLAGQNVPVGSAPSLEKLQPTSEFPVSSLNLRNPGQLFPYFPAAAVTEPNFAVRLAGEFLAEADGEYQFAMATPEGARMTVDGKPVADAASAVTLTAGWKRFEIVVWRTAGSAEMVVTYVRPGTAERQPIPVRLLRSQPLVPTARTGNDGQFEFSAPIWMGADVEAVAAGGAGRGQLRSAGKSTK